MLFRSGFLEKFMGNLEKNTYTVTGFAFCILTCAVFQMFYLRIIPIPPGWCLLFCRLMVLEAETITAAFANSAG